MRGNTVLKQRPKTVLKDPAKMKNRLLVLLVASLALAYVPLEIAPSMIGTAEIAFVVILFLGIKYRVFTGRFGMVELAGSLLILWVGLRMTVLAFLEGQPVTLASLRDAMAIFGALVLYRIAQKPELRKPIINGMTIGLIGALLLMAFQMLIGLPYLRGAGYIPPLFNFDTASGTYRPFGGYFTPVTFGAYLAMTLCFLWFSRTYGGMRALIILGAGAVGLMLTYTRSAWLGAVAGILVGAAMLWLAKGRDIRIPIISIPLVPLGILLLIANPGLLSDAWARLLTVGDADYGSNTIRLSIWEGTIANGAESPIIGQGPVPFADAMRGELGALSAFGHAHSTFLMVYYQYGIVGMLLLIALLVTMMVSLFKAGSTLKARAAGVAVLVAFTVCSLVETTWGSFHLLVLVFLAVGAGTAMGGTPTPLTPPRPTTTRLRQSRA